MYTLVTTSIVVLIISSALLISYFIYAEDNENVPSIVRTLALIDGGIYLISLGIVLYSVLTQ